MRRTVFSIPLLWIFGVCPAGAVSSTPASPYAGQERREVKGLSADEMADYAAGRGMGLARVAELNGYPGPMHVLELADRLHLSEDQRTRTEALQRAMRARAMALGQELIEAERRLDQQFAAHTITASALADLLARIGALQARVRQAHLEAHLEQGAILTAEQIARYNALRGYGPGAHEGAPGHRHH